MINISINLIKLSQKEAKAQKVGASYFVNFWELTESDRIAADILAPLSVDALFTSEGDYYQASAASFGKLGELFANNSVMCGGALWLCADCQQTRNRLTTPKGYTVKGFGKCSPRGCFVLITENNKQQERAYLVRPNW